MSQIASAKSSTFTSLRRKTMVSVLRTWQEIRGTARMAITGKLDPSLPKEDVPHLIKQMKECLNSRGGEVTARAMTAELGRTYLGLNDTGRAQFLRTLAEKFALDPNKVAKKTDAYQKATSEPERIKAEQELRDALVSPRSIILRQFNTLPNGFKFLVDLRYDLLPLIGKDVYLAGLEADLKNILSGWFDIGLLDLAEITWNSPAALLEKLIAYEAVHKVASWDDLKNRLDADRRVYAFFHSKMPLEPLIFVHVALVKGLSDNVQALLDQSKPVMNVEDADTAIFYSISNAQKGLVGISFGNFLIKRVVGQLWREVKQIKHYSTLSPVPGFRTWLDPLLAKGDESILQPAEIASLKSISKSANAAQGLSEILSTEWHKDKKIADKLKPILMRLGAHYLLNEKRKQNVLDPVAHFHLTNGSRLERINWLGDTSPKGLKQSAGLMVNYYYDLDTIDDNHEDYATEGKIAVSRGVRGLI